MKRASAITRTASVLLLLVAVAALSVLLAPPLADAGHDRHHDHLEARELLRRGEILPLSRILEQVRKRQPGDVIEVELEHSDHHGWEYEVKVLTSEGRVRKVKVNAGDGSIRKIEDD
ncbi:MAG TPA: PepSY domain-containing protein [Rhodanobacteraceae bacterium]|nr:PepSY domain-containing protein [Rhodanobacteraceae bacterium]